MYLPVFRILYQILHLGMQWFPWNLNLFWHAYHKSRQLGI